MNLKRKSLSKPKTQRTSARRTSEICIDIDGLMPNYLVPVYLMACYLYYECDKPIMSDAEFDRLSKRLKREWDIVVHRHKRLLNRDSIGSGYYLRGRYPLMVQCSALQWYQALRG